MKIKGLLYQNPIGFLSSLILLFLGIGLIFVDKIGSLITFVAFILILVITLVHSSFSIITTKRYVKQLNKSLRGEIKNIDSFPLPCVLCDSNGVILWHNKLFLSDILADGEIKDFKITDCFKKFSISDFSNEESVCVEYNERLYTVFSTKIKEKKDKFIALYFLDDTYCKTTEKEYLATRPYVMHILVDSIDILYRKYSDSKFASITSGIESLLEKWLEKLTSNPVKGVLLGAGVTALIQSSAATTVMLVGFVNSGIMKLAQAIGVIMGANIGTTATAWLLSLSSISGSGILNIFKPTTFTPVLAVIGIILVMFVKSDKKNTLGLVLVGFATLMFGMNTMSAAVKPLEGDPQFCSIMTMFSNPLLGVLVGALMTAALQSSSVSVGILQSLSNATGGITYAIALPIILGSNIGSCVTAMISSVGANKSARRVAIVHLFFNIIGTLLFLSLFYLLNAFLHFTFLDDVLNSTGIAVIHTVFNVLATSAFLPFTKQIEKLAHLIIRDDPNDDSEDSKVPILDERLLLTPSVAIEQCRNVAIRMARITRKTINSSIDTLTEYEQKMTENKYLKWLLYVINTIKTEIKLIS